MASKLINALNQVFSDPQYSERIPQNVRTQIANNGFGSVELDNDTANNIFSALVNKWARQDLYSFEFNDIDLSRFDKGYLAYGDIIEDDYIDITSASEFPAITQGGSVNPFVINLPTIKPSYYMGTYSLQYSVTTRTMDVKKAFMSENACNNFIARSRAVLPESLKLDRYLITRNMLSSMEYAKSFETNVNAVEEGADYISYLTPQQVQDMIYKIKMASTAMTKSSRAWNKLGVMNSCPKKHQVLFINSGVYQLMKTVLYNTYHNNVDFGLDEKNIIEISGFGTDAANSGLYAVLIDERALKAFDTEKPDMENIYNPAGKYWNTFLNYQGKIAYSLHACSAKFSLNETANA